MDIQILVVRGDKLVKDIEYVGCKPKRTQGKPPVFHWMFSGNYDGLLHLELGITNDPECHSTSPVGAIDIPVRQLPVKVLRFYDSLPRRWRNSALNMVEAMQMAIPPYTHLVVDAEAGRKQKIVRVHVRIKRFRATMDAEWRIMKHFITRRYRAP